jgi:hypothetical protein
MNSPADEQPLSRRQLRELQRSGRAPAPVPARGPAEATVERDDEAQPETAYAKVAPTDEVIETAEIVSPLPTSAEGPEPQGSHEPHGSHEPLVPVLPADGRPLTRRQAREMERTRTAAISVIPADQGAAASDTSEVVTAEPIDEVVADHEPVEEPEAELELVESGASETGDLTEAIVETDVAESDVPSGTAADAETTPESDAVVSEHFGEAALETDSDPLAEEKPFDSIIATGIADAEPAVTTSSTLILGSPMSTFTGPIGGTGEIMVTGSIDLPRALSGTTDPGSQDRADYDRSLDHEPPAPPTAGTPVSASRAVSTHTSARDIIAPPPRSKKPAIVPVLAIIAGVLMVAVLAVVVTSLLTGQF